MNNQDQKYEKFKVITGYDIRLFFSDFVTFVNQYYPFIVDYYNGGTIDQETFYKLNLLTKEMDKIEPLFTLCSNTLDDIDSWELLDIFTEIQTKLWTIRNSAKWLRSTFDNVRSNTVKMEQVLSTDESFEDIAQKNLSSSNPQDDWLNIVVPQYINEEDYTPQSSPIFSINLEQSRDNYIDNIVDTLSGKSILGIDIDKNFLFENDDLKVVSYDDAIKQALELIQSSLKGFYPEFPNYGITNDIIGTTINAVQYPTIFKNLINMFQRDGRWKSVELIDLYTEQDSIFLKIKATTVTKEDFIVNIPI